MDDSGLHKYKLKHIKFNDPLMHSSANHDNQPQHMNKTLIEHTAILYRLSALDYYFSDLLALYVYTINTIAEHYKSTQIHLSATHAHN